MINKIVVCLFVAVTAEEVVTQNTESNINFVTTQTSELITGNSTQNVSIATNPPPINETELIRDVEEVEVVEEPNFIIKLYNSLVYAIQSFFSSPKVITVMHNIGTCMVNGVMEIVAYYVPGPMIPLLASAAGFVIPFEPVVTLRRRMPVSSYRRAFDKAVNSFMGTFEKYKDFDTEDPYMTRRFNRRFMNDSPEKTKRNKRDDSKE